MAYGLEVYDANGTTPVLAPDKRYASVLTIQDFALASGESVLIQCDMTGTDASNTQLVIQGGTYTTLSSITSTRETTGLISTQGFEITANNTLVTGTAIVIRF